MKQKIEDLRLQIDKAAKLTQQLNSGKIDGELIFSFELYEAEKSLRLAKAWAGFLMGELGGTSPYKNDGKRKDAKDIEPLNASADGSEFPADRTNNVQKIDRLREEIEDLRTVVRTLDRAEKDEDLQITRELATCRTNVWNALSEAKMHLGFELGRIRDEALAKTE